MNLLIVVHWPLDIKHDNDAFSMFHAASMLNWSLIPLLDLMAFLFIQYTASRKGEKLVVILAMYS